MARYRRKRQSSSRRSYGISLSEAKARAKNAVARSKAYANKKSKKLITNLAIVGAIGGVGFYFKDKIKEILKIS